MSDKQEEVQENEGAISTLQEQVKQIYEFRDYYLFKRSIDEAPRKENDVKNELKKVMEKFDEFEEAAQKENRAKFFYLKGRALNILSDHNPEAEQYLSKAIKLDTNLLTAWNELGFCYWKRGDVAGAKNCFLKNPKDRVALRSLSILLRQQAVKNQEERMKNIEEGLAKASEAVEMDPSDGLSWLVLGNSYLISFFSIAQSQRKMKQALAAYIQAEKDAVAKVDPDLYYNKGIALQYQEDYLAALECYNRAGALDPEWNLPKEKETKLVRYLDTAQQLTTTHGKLRPKKLHTMLKSLSLKQLGPYEGGEFVSTEGKKHSLHQVNLQDLKAGLNAETVVMGKVVSGIHSEDSVAFAFCLTDIDETCMVVTVYNLAAGKGVIIGDTVAIPEPYLTQVRFTYKEKDYKFDTIRVSTPLVLVVNGRRLGREVHACTSVSTIVSSVTHSEAS